MQKDTKNRIQMVIKKESRTIKIMTEYIKIIRDSDKDLHHKYIAQI